MRDRKVAVRYAGALLNSAKAEGVLQGVADSYAAVVEVFAAHPEVKAFLEGPQVAESEKKHVLESVFGERVEPVLLRFFHLLIDKNRIESLQDIGEEFASLVEQDQGIVRAAVVTAIPLPGDLEAALEKKLAGLTGARIIMDKRVDPAVIGGVKVTMRDKVLDGTVRTNLDLLRRQLGKTAVR